MMRQTRPAGTGADLLAEDLRLLAVELHVGERARLAQLLQSLELGDLTRSSRHPRHHPAQSGGGAAGSRDDGTLVAPPEALDQAAERDQEGRHTHQQEGCSDDDPAELYAVAVLDAVVGE